VSRPQLGRTKKHSGRRDGAEIVSDVMSTRDGHLLKHVEASSTLRRMKKKLVVGFVSLVCLVSMSWIIVE
jgi:hypothetical protein